MGWFGIGSEIGVAGEGVKSALDSVGGLAKSIRTAITGVDVEKQAEIEELLVELDTKIVDGQNQVNIIQAASSSVFIAGWKPAIGWVCAGSLGLYYPVRIILGMGLWSYYCLKGGQLLPMPEVGISEILGLVGALLGSITFRSLEKKWGVQNEH